MIKRKKTLLILILAFFSGLAQLQAQSTIGSAGGEATGSGGSVSFTTGQIVYKTQKGGSGKSMAEGVQQPYEISIISGIDEAKDIGLSVSLYPNPASDYLTLKVQDPSGLSYRLYDIQGRLLETQKIIGTTTEIELKHLANAAYFLKILRDRQQMKTFKIIKN